MKIYNETKNYIKNWISLSKLDSIFFTSLLLLYIYIIVIFKIKSIIKMPFDKQIMIFSTLVIASGTDTLMRLTLISGKNLID